MRLLLLAIGTIPIFALVVRENILASRERKRRRSLPEDERLALEQDDAVWMQTFTF